MANKKPVGRKPEFFHYPKGTEYLSITIRLSKDDFDLIPCEPSKADNVRQLIKKTWEKNDLSPL